MLSPPLGPRRESPYGYDERRPHRVENSESVFILGYQE